MHPQHTTPPPPPPIPHHNNTTQHNTTPHPTPPRHPPPPPTPHCTDTNTNTNYTQLYIYMILVTRQDAKGDNEQETTTLHCDVCGSEDEAVAEQICKDCNEALCKFHVKDHKKRAATKGHNLVSIAEGRLLLQEKKKTKQSHCARHPKKVLKLFCESCDDIICRDCTFDTHRTHSCILIAAAAEKESAEVLQLLQHSSQSSENVKQLLEKTKRHKQELLVSIAMATDQVNACFDDVVAQAELREVTIA